MDTKTDLVAAIRLAAHDCTAQGNQMAANELLDAVGQARALIAALEQIHRLSHTADRSKVDVVAMLGDIAINALTNAGVDLS